MRAAAVVWRLFEYFYEMIKIHCNRCKAVLSHQWEFIFMDSDGFQFKLSISRCSFIQLSLHNLRVLQFFREGCKFCRYDKTNLPLFCLYGIGVPFN